MSMGKWVPMEGNVSIIDNGFREPDARNGRAAVHFSLGLR
jgi:hypothetical protein